MAASSGAVPKWCSDRQLTVKCQSIDRHMAAICGNLLRVAAKEERKNQRKKKYIYSFIIYIIFQSNDNTY